MKRQEGILAYTTRFMKVLGIIGGLADGVIKSLQNGESFVESESYPAIFKCYKELHIKLNMFPSMPMHLCFLGVEKSLIDQTKNIILNGKQTFQEKFWKQLIQPMCTRQQAVNKLLIDWCLPMSFSGEKQNDIGYASWQADHCLAFTRIS